MIFKKKKFWGTVIAIALLAFCFRSVRYEDMRSLAERIDYIYLVPTVVCATLFYIFRALRWRLIVSQVKAIRISRSILLYSAGQILNAVMPALAGQVGRMFLFSRKEGLRKSFVFSTILLELLFDAMSLILFILLTSVTFVFPDEYRLAGIIMSAATAVGLILLYVFLHYQARLEEFGRRHLRPRWPGAYISIKKSVRSFTTGIKMLRSSRHLSRSLAFSLLQWLSHILTIYLLMRAFGFEWLTFAAAVAIMIVNQIAVMIPITPGNAGTFELMVSASLTAFKVSSSDAVLFAIALHVIDLLPVFVMGYIFVQREKVSLARIKAEHEEESVLDELSEEGVLIDDEEKV
jgi:uncharacterized protein (TIRG00374 family)